jgi:hypothetical protein
MIIRRARKRIAKAFKRDPAFRRGYVDNVACVLMDHIPSMAESKADRDLVADAIIRKILE